MKKITLLLLVTLVSVVASATVGEEFEVGYLKYRVVVEPPAGAAQVDVVGLSSTGKTTSNLSLSFRTSIGHGNYTYSLRSIAPKSFFNQTNIIGAEFPGSFEAIGDSAFCKCTNLVSVVFSGSGPKKIEEYSFMKTGLTSVTIPSGVEHLRTHAFRGCESMTAINVNANNAKYASFKGLVYDKALMWLNICPTGRTEPLREEDFPAKFYAVNAEAFMGCEVTGIYFPYGLTYLYDRSLAYLNNRAKVIKIPSSLKTVGNYVFLDTNPADLYINLTEPPAFPKQEFERYLVYHRLHVPKNCQSRYNTGHWSEWEKVIDDAYDVEGYHLFSSRNASGQKIYYGEARFSLNSFSAPVPGHEEYAGSAELVYQSDVTIPGTLTIPDYIVDYHDNKKYEVSTIEGWGVCRDGIRVDFSLVLGCNVGVVMQEAFKGLKHLVSVNLGTGVANIGGNAFADCNISNDIVIPYGGKWLNASAFNNNPIKRLIIPSSLIKMYPDGFAGLDNLEELVINNLEAVKMYNCDLSGIPATCKILVPTGCVQQYKNHSDWGKFQISAGAFDFVFGNKLDFNRYRMTVTSKDPITVDGVTYDGTAKYVYHPDIATSSLSFNASNSEVNELNRGTKKYLMTELGDSLCYGAANIPAVNISEMKHLERIGDYALAGSGITSFTTPSTLTYIGKQAFVGCKNLKELFITQPVNNYSWGGQFYGNNASDFTCYVKWTSLPNFQNSIANWTKYNGVDPLNQLNGYVQLNNSYKAMAIAVNHPVEWSTSGMKAYTVPSYDPSTKIATTKAATRTGTNKGVIVTDYVKDQIYKLKRPTATVYNTTNLLTGAADASVDVYAQPGGYLFDGSVPVFWRPTTKYSLNRGYAYLKLDEAVAGSTTRVYLDLFAPTPDFKKGDVNGDGMVDVSDINIIINLVLGKDTASKYNGRADVDGNGTIDVSDLNIVINIILGK